MPPCFIPAPRRCRARGLPGREAARLCDGEFRRPLPPRRGWLIVCTGGSRMRSMKIPESGRLPAAGHWRLRRRQGEFLNEAVFHRGRCPAACRAGGGRAAQTHAHHVSENLHRRAAAGSGDAVAHCLADLSVAGKTGAGAVAGGRRGCPSTTTPPRKCWPQNPNLIVTDSFTPPALRALIARSGARVVEVPPYGGFPRHSPRRPPTRHRGGRKGAGRGADCRHGTHSLPHLPQPGRHGRSGSRAGAAAVMCPAAAACSMRSSGRRAARNIAGAGDGYYDVESLLAAAPTSLPMATSMATRQACAPTRTTIPCCADISPIAASPIRRACSAAVCRKAQGRRCNCARRCLPR